jgi:hypothetical protein
MGRDKIASFDELRGFTLKKSTFENALVKTLGRCRVHFLIPEPLYFLPLRRNSNDVAASQGARQSFG